LKALIQVENLRKHFGEVVALDGISFSVDEGELFGFLGPNGAGKTTTIKILTGIARADSGKVMVAGFDCMKDPKSHQHLIGIVPDESNLYPELSGFDNLCFCGALYGMAGYQRKARAAELVEAFGLGEIAHRKFGTYSKGMKRRVTIAAALMHHPGILFLDEPTSGIDVASARKIRQLIADLHRGGVTIFLTTHYIEEAERLCERIAFIVEGKIVRIDSIKNLIESTGETKALLVSVDAATCDLIRGLQREFSEFRFTWVGDGKIRVEYQDEISIAALVNFMESQGAEVTEARRVLPSLEDVFVKVTGLDKDLMQKDDAKQ